MKRIGELVHIDCHQLSHGITIAEPKSTRYYFDHSTMLEVVR